MLSVCFLVSGSKVVIIVTSSNAQAAFLAPVKFIGVIPYFDSSVQSKCLQSSVTQFQSHGGVMPSAAANRILGDLENVKLHETVKKLHPIQVLIEQPQ